jgi:hypothetical protein
MTEADEWAKSSIAPITLRIADERPTSGPISPIPVLGRSAAKVFPLFETSMAVLVSTMPSPLERMFGPSIGYKNATEIN